ncbi:two-component system response regulator ChvI [Shimia isoporae]|uniref:Two-component system response regulator ChvI n=1 Tax=Shimia isoporae TaxID=647720 RepID=A0A4R1NY18_9RHOB|nr:response regulator transcription factor [Shimia isoporae]TCL10102.1 two-component system response regulator ChvI [Shimia isoporae]
MGQIILIDGDRPSLNALVRLLESDGHRVRGFLDAETAMRDLSDPLNTLLITNTRLPGLDGMDLLRRLRSNSDLPVMLLSDARSDTEEAVGLHMGADDYVRKPYATRVMLERVRALLRRGRTTAQGPNAAARLLRGPLMMDRESYETRWNGQTLSLTATEFNVLWTLADRPGAVLDRAQILEAAYGTDLGVTDRSIDSQIKRLRMKLRKLDPEFESIETLYGLGYRYSLPGSNRVAA